ncbi:permease [Streptosporangium jomthongense]|jgi:predicted permease|uniref:AEC family transporter n=1 Tax=Marinobacter aromaticivorans TaxID=1494078 RepID=A0ABW2J0U7_9GAMM|nr:AEC family transporter [Marinobacter aromaticivorans]GGE81092.1 permease [Streptosporangium jomthongense]
MQQIFLVTFPFFALVLCGYLAARFKVLQLDAIPGLNGFVLYFALPCMLYRFGASTPIDKLLDPGLFITYLICALIMLGVTIAVTLRGRIGWKDASFGALVAAFPNSGFMGMPLLIALIGPAVAGPLLISISIDMVITSSICIALASRSAGESQGVVKSITSALKRVAVNPLPWAILLGGAASATNFNLPGPLRDTVDMLADAGSPTALFTIGAVLARSQMTVLGGSMPTARRFDIPVIVTLKLLIHPLLVLGIGYIAIALGADIGVVPLGLLALVAALPSASNVPMLSERFNADTGRVAKIVLLSTALSFLTFSSAVVWLSP